MFNKLLFDQGDYLSKTTDQTINGTLAINSVTGDLTVPISPIGANSAVARDYVLELLNSSGAKTISETGANMANTATSSTAGIAKVGLDIQSTGTWNGAGSTNTGLNVNVSGGTTNYAATFMGGNVGIGTTDPLSNLHVKGTTGIKFESTSITQATGITLPPYANLSEYGFIGNAQVGFALAGLLTNTNVSTGIAALSAPASDVGAQPMILLEGAGHTTNAYSGRVAVTTRPILGVYNNATPLMTVLAGGNVGIGTTTPATKLQVNGQLELGAVTTAGVPLNQLSFTNLGTNFAQFYDPGLTGANGGIAIGGATTITTAPTSPIMFWNTSSGNVGIGTATPSATLDVNGSMRVSGMSTDSSGVKTQAWDVANYVNASNIYQILEMGRDPANWVSSMHYEVTVRTHLYGGGGYVRAIVSYGYGDSGTLNIIESAGPQPLLIFLDPEVNVNANSAHRQINIQLPPYIYAHVEVKYDTTEVGSNPGSGQVHFVNAVVGGGSGAYHDGTITKLNVAGNVGIGTTSSNANAKLTLAGGGINLSSQQANELGLNEVGWIWHNSGPTAMYRGNNKFIIKGNTGGSFADNLVVDTNGFVGIGLTNPTYQLQLSTDSAAKPGTSTWTIASDARLKNVRAPFLRGLDAMEGIHPIYFKYKEGNELGLPTDKEYVGIIAQDAKKVVPEAVQTDDKGFLHVTNDSIIWTMFNGVKELYGQFKALVARVINLESKDIAKEHAIASVEAENVKLKQENAAIKARLDKIEKAFNSKK